ncbi:uncharacterized protein [Montipora capricornis]|uniref:uncharacterized protein isoform X4 n=1 Tax=Montipora capricornis TaxID=246305 RepID=UPI0035F17A2F
MLCQKQFLTVDAFRVQVENGLENIIFLHFSFFFSFFLHIMTAVVHTGGYAVIQVKHRRGIGLQDDWTAYDKRTEKKEERKKTRTTKRYTKHFKNADENRRKLRARKSTEKSKENRGWSGCSVSVPGSVSRLSC